MTTPDVPAEREMRERVNEALDRFAQAVLSNRESEPERLAVLDLLAPQEARGRGTTHYEGCWRTRGHHECAIAEIERRPAPDGYVSAATAFDLRVMGDTVSARTIWKNSAPDHDVPVFLGESGAAR